MHEEQLGCLFMTLELYISVICSEVRCKHEYSNLNVNNAWVVARNKEIKSLHLVFCLKAFEKNLIRNLYHKFNSISTATIVSTFILPNVN